MSLGTWAELVIVTGDGPGKQPEYSGIGSIHYSRRAEGNGTWILHCRQGQSQFLRGLSAIVTVKIKKKIQMVVVHGFYGNQRGFRDFGVTWIFQKTHRGERICSIQAPTLEHWNSKKASRMVSEGLSSPISSPRGQRAEVATVKFPYLPSTPLFGF